MEDKDEKTWIVHQTSTDGLVQLISKGKDSGIIPIGTFLTVEDGTNKFFLRVNRSVQEEIFKPSGFASLLVKILNKISKFITLSFFFL